MKIPQVNEKPKTKGYCHYCRKTTEFEGDQYTNGTMYHCTICDYERWVQTESQKNAQHIYEMECMDLI